MNYGVGWVSNEVESKWNREGRGGEVRDVVDGNRSRATRAGAKQFHHTPLSGNR